MRIMTCGAGGLLNEDLVKEVLDLLHDMFRIVEVIQADPTGSDVHSGAWARGRGIPTSLARADILVFGPFKRKRQRMPSEDIDLLMAFPGWAKCGLYDPVVRARGAGIKILHL